MSDVVAIARAWIGTPYLHQASCRGAGCDCLGLVRGIWRELRGAEPVAIPPYSRQWDEISPREILWNAAATYLSPAKAEWSTGDVLLFRMREGAPAKHLGILSRQDQFIHAYEGHGVVESPLGTAWRRRVVARFRFHGGAD